MILHTSYPAKYKKRYFFKEIFNRKTAHNYYDKSNEEHNLTSLFFVALRPNAGHGLLILEGFFLDQHNDAPQSVGILWTSDQLVAETST